MAHLRLYRLAFVPALAALVVLAFSLEGVPEPADPPPGTLEFDATEAAKSTREVLAAGARRTPGSPADNEVADLVADRFRSVVSGELSEQVVEAEVDGEEVELRNVLLSLPGESERVIAVIAGRDTRAGDGAPSGAAATGVLLELVSQLAVAGRNRTIVFASTSGASAQAEGARELVRGLSERYSLDAAIVVSQPGFEEPMEPHLVLTGGSQPIGLARTAEEILDERAELHSGRAGPLGQIARYAIPAAAGEQAALLREEVDAVALSSAGEVPLPAADTAPDRLDKATLGRLGGALLALVSAVDAAAEPPEAVPRDSLWVGGNIVPGWSIGLLGLALTLPAAAVAASVLSEGRRRGEAVGRAFSWALEWWLPPTALLLGLLALGFTRVIPASGVPYDPQEVDLSAAGAIGLLCVLALAAWLWWVLSLRRVPDATGPSAAAGACGLTCVAGCLIAWVANPYLALVLVPLAHTVALHAASRRRPAIIVLASVLAVVPLMACVLYVASALDWGAGAPLQLAALASGGGIGPLEVLGIAFAVSAAAGVGVAALGPRTRPAPGPKGPGRGASPQARPRG
jgi:hypothetical protein